jgi:hypothetical protein
MKKPLAIASSGMGRELRGRDQWGDLTKIQYKPIWNPSYEYILRIYPLKIYNKKKELSTKLKRTPTTPK